jgi:hypothetical protein
MEFSILWQGYRLSFSRQLNPEQPPLRSGPAKANASVKPYGENSKEKTKDVE